MLNELRIGIVANEPSGDQLGAGLICAIKQRVDHATFEGVGGPLMQQAGCRSLIPIESLSVMGLVEVVKHLPQLIFIRRQLIQHFLTHPPHIFIGIDAPDFNLTLERRLSQAGIPTVHYVSPTVWAWRAGRVHTIRRSVDLILSIYPFETQFLKQQALPVTYVGHPLAQQLPLIPDQHAARIALHLPTDAPILALLPGSRVSEVNNLVQVFLETANFCQHQKPGLHCVAPLVNSEIYAMVAKAWSKFAPNLLLTLVNGNSHQVLAAADVVLTASGTATLEAMLNLRPMVVAYRLHPLTYWIANTFNLVKVPYVALSNLLVGEALAPEFLQHRCQAPDMGRAVLNFFNDKERVLKIQQRYLSVHEQLKGDVAANAADAVLAMVKTIQFN